MYKFIAYSSNIHGQYTNRLLSVYADDHKQARYEVERALNRPGRRYLLAEWRRSGEFVLREGG